jgi:hypothetical protein
MAINCMSTSVADYDGDLDMDVYITAFPGDENWMLVNNDYAFSAVNEDSWRNSNAKHASGCDLLGRELVGCRQQWI